MHYVAPSVWAYKPHRAAKVAALYDHLLCLLPFEPPYFEVEGLKSTFIGHPITESPATDFTSDFLIEAGFVASLPTLAIMPGSRSGELKRLLPVFEETVKRITQKHPDLQTIVLSTPRFHERLEDATKNWSNKHIVLSEKSQKDAAIRFATAALAKSGTGSVELSLAHLPTVIAYKVNPLSAWMLRRMIQVDFVNLVNIILNREVIPECLQQECTPRFIEERLLPLLTSEESRKIQLDQAEEALIQLGKGQEIPPSKKAAQTILSLLH